jgi:hypothetical protein
MKKFIANLIWKFYKVEIRDEVKKELCSFLKAMFDSRNIKGSVSLWNNSYDYYWIRIFNAEDLISINNIIIEAVDQRYKNDIVSTVRTEVTNVLEEFNITREQFIDNVVERINKKKVL